MDANDFPLLGDDHDVGIFADLEGGDAAVAVGGLEVDDALAAAGSDAVFSERSALAAQGSIS